MVTQRKRPSSRFRGFGFAIGILLVASIAAARTPRTISPPGRPAPASIKIDDFLNVKPAADLALGPDGERKAGALMHFVQGMAFEENGEMDRALEEYRKVLNVDPGQSELASRVAGLLIRQESFPEAVDILKELIQA